MTKNQKINYRSEAHKLQLDNIRLTAEVEKLRKLLHEIYDNCEQCRDFEIVGFRCARCQTIERILRGEG